MVSIIFTVFNSSLVLLCLTFSSAWAESKNNEAIFFDNFEYDVQRDNPDGRKLFIAKGWSHAKAVNLTGSHAGYLYTVDRIPGFKGLFPGKESKYVLAVEGKPTTFNAQTDFYLQYGFKGKSVPADVWFQFWIYINNYDDPNDKEDQISHFGLKRKIIYPTKDRYPTHSGLWLLGCCSSSHAPYKMHLGDAAPQFFMHLGDLENINYWGRGKKQWKIGQTDLSEQIIPNRWTLVKSHMDTSTTSGKFEQWFKTVNGKWVKVAEWIDGVTPEFEWKIPASDVGGHRAFRIPTTFNQCRKRNESCDFWIYLDDFVMANSELALPKY